MLSYVGDAFLRYFTGYNFLLVPSWHIIFVSDTMGAGKGCPAAKLSNTWRGNHPSPSTCAQAEPGHLVGTHSSDLPPASALNHRVPQDFQMVTKSTREPEPLSALFPPKSRCCHPSRWLIWASLSFPLACDLAVTQGRTMEGFCVSSWELPGVQGLQLISFISCTLFV